MSIRELLDPTNSALIFIDHQPQMSFGVANIDRQTLKNNTAALETVSDHPAGDFPQHPPGACGDRHAAAVA